MTFKKRWQKPFLLPSKDISNNYRQIIVDKFPYPDYIKSSHEGWVPHEDGAKSGFFIIWG
jgi:hypothetical protein